MTILIIDDNSVDRSAYRRFLETSDGYVIFEAEDGKAGLDMAQQLRPNCILLSLKLKDQSGLEVLVKLRDEASTSVTPVIMISTGIAKVVVDAALSHEPEDALPPRTVDMAHQQGAEAKAPVVGDSGLRA